MWELEYGHDYRKQMKRREESKMPSHKLPELPEFFKNKPQLPRYLTSIQEAFFELSTNRQIGFGVGQIPSVAINDYLDHTYCDEEYRDLFRRMIRTVDNDYVAFINKDKKDGKS